MILHNDSSEVTTIGDIQENQVSIDARNINHIVTILSSNLYSNPVESFLRETISNAVDSHTEAGVTEPIIMTITEDTIAIRDFGVGISPERFKEIYLNIGSSTKRESNDYIGSFGIGRFSALSCSSLVNVTSIYNGKAYYYLMTRNANKLSIDLINTIDSTEHNGVEVKIPIDSARKYYNALPSLMFIPNIYVTGFNCSEIVTFNERTITDYKTFKTCDISCKDRFKILIGNIIYNLKESYIPSNCRKYDSVFKYIYPKFNIGDLDVTPNREELLYSDRTIDAISKKFIEVSKEIEELIEIQYTDCTTDIMSYLYTNIFDRCKNFKIGNDSVYLESSLINFKYKDKTFSNSLLQALDYLIRCHIKVASIFECKGNNLYRGERDCDNSFFILVGRHTWKADVWKTVSKRKFLVLPSTKGITGKYFYGYLRTKYPNEEFLVTSDIVKPFLKAKLKYAIKNYALDKKDIQDLFFIIKEFIKALPDYCIYDDIFNSDSYKQYKKNMSSPTVKIATNTTIYFHGYSEYRRTDSSLADVNRIVGDWEKVAKDRWNNKKFTKIKAIEGDPFIEILNFIMDSKNFVVVAVANTNKKWLNNLSKEYVDIDEFKKPNRKMSLLYTSYKLRGTDDYNHDLWRFDKNLIKCLTTQDVKKIKYYQDNYNNSYLTNAQYEILGDIFNKCTIDEELVNAYYRVNELYKLYTKQWEIIGYTNKYNALFAFLCMKKGLFRINNKTYQTIKQLMKHETD